MELKPYYIEDTPKFPGEVHRAAHRVPMPDRHKGRQRVRTFAIDEYYSRVCEDGVHTTPGGIGVDIVDPSILVDYPILVQEILARRKVQYTRSDTRVQDRVDLIPSQLVQKFSLLKGTSYWQPTISLPVETDKGGRLKTRGFVLSQAKVVNNLDHIYVSQILRDKKHAYHDALKKVQEMALLIESTRQGISQVTLQSEREETFSKGKNLVNVLMNHFNDTATSFARDHNIPVLGNQTCSFTNPLRTAKSFINMSNLSAFLRQQPLPFSAEDVEHISDYHTEAKAARMLYYTSQTRTRVRAVLADPITLPAPVEDFPETQGVELTSREYLGLAREVSKCSANPIYEKRRAQFAERITARSMADIPFADAVSSFINAPSILPQWQEMWFQLEGTETGWRCQVAAQIDDVLYTLPQQGNIKIDSPWAAFKYTTKEFWKYFSAGMLVIRPNADGLAPISNLLKEAPQTTSTHGSEDASVPISLREETAESA